MNLSLPLKVIAKLETYIKIKLGLNTLQKHILIGVKKSKIDSNKATAWKKKVTVS